MYEKLSLNTLFSDQIKEFPLYVKLFNPQFDRTFHTHDFVEVAMILEGTAEHILNEYGKISILHPGDLIIIPRNFGHAYQNCSRDFTLVNILFIPEKLPLSTLDLYLLPGYKLIFARNEERPTVDKLLIHCEKKEFALLKHLAFEMLQEHNMRTPGYFFTMFGAFMMFAGHVARLCSYTHFENKTRFSNIAKVITCLNVHYREHLEIEKLCKLAGMSRSTLARYFIRSTGVSPIEYQMRLRIAEAVNMLRTGDETIAEISLKLGFKDSNYFGRQFKRITGTSPGKFRKQR